MGADSAPTGRVLFALCGYGPDARKSRLVEPRDVLTDDVTRPQIGEESARVAANRMAFAANTLPALIAYVDTNLRYVWVNDAYPRWFGLCREEILGRHLSEVLDPVAWAAVKPYTDRALDGEEVAFDNKVVLSGGAARDVRASYVPDRDDGARVCGFVVLVTDMTETKAVERAMRRSERLLEQSQAAAHVGSWEVTFDEKFSEVPGSYFWSSETYRIFGVEPSTPASLSLFYSRVHPDERPAMLARARPNFDAGRNVPVGVSHRAP